jgi:hypothetical protein
LSRYAVPSRWPSPISFWSLILSVSISRPFLWMTSMSGSPGFFTIVTSASDVTSSGSR